MIAATAKAPANSAPSGCHASVTPVTTTGMVLPPPSAVSARRGVVPRTSLLVPSMLSELSFDQDLPLPDLQKLMSPKKKRTTARKGSLYDDKGEDIDDNESSSSSRSLLSSWSWNGLLCFSFGDPDLFFDAEENLSTTEDGMDTNGKLIGLGKTISTAELSEHSAESIESVEIKLGKHGGSSVVATACELRGGQHQPRPVSSPQQTRAAFGHPPRMLPKENPNPGEQAPQRSPAPPAPQELPVRFLRAGKGDPVEGQRRYEATLQWRKEHGIDNILFEPHPLFEMVKRNYPHYFHLRGKKNEPVFFEQPPKTDLPALRRGGMDLLGLVRHYTMITEFQWQFIERDDFARSITVLDLEGMRMMDFVGECVEYVKMCSTFTGQHYPERAGHVIVVNVPRWFAMIWKVVKPMVDEVTLKKISIVRGQDAVFAALAEKIPVENIPPEYGGKSMPLGESPEEHALRDLMNYNNAVANGENPPSEFSSWGPVRSY